MIFGAVNLNQSVSFQNQVLEKMRRQLSWPDSCMKSFSYNSFSGYYLYDKKLPSPNLVNIFYHDERRSIYIMVDGTIYNDNEILNLLKINNKISVPELILEAYDKWGITFADKFNGDFAIILFHENKKQIIAVSDHMGNRPIAFSSTGSLFYFGTEAIGLCKALYPNDKIDKEYLLNIFLQEGYNYILLPNRKVKKIKPGHYLKFTSDHLEHSPYWFPDKINEDQNLIFNKVVEDLGPLLADAVAIRADRNYTAATHISGGLDSGLISALTRRIYSDQTDFYGLSWTPETEIESQKYKKDERIIIKKFCRENKMIPVFTDYDEDDYLAFLSEWRHPSEFLYEGKTIETAKKYEINLILSGWGGDEFLSISDTCIDAELIRKLEWVHFLKRYPVRKFKKFISALIFKGLFPAYKRSYLKYKALPEIYPYISQTLRNNLIPRSERFCCNSRRLLHLQFLSKYALTARTTDWYVLGQRNGIEYRYPMLDKRIVEYMLKVPSRSLVNGSMNRILIRNIGKKYLPEEILKGNKTDPVNYNQFEKVSNIVGNNLIHEFNSFRNNPDLSFIDFSRLEKQLEVIKNQKHLGGIETELLILHYLKKAHEFTKGYYSKNGK